MQYLGDLANDRARNDLIVQTDKRTIRAAIIDRSLLWFGSIDLAGSHHREEDNVMRVLAPVIASEMLEYVIGGIP